MQPYLAQIILLGFNFSPRGWLLCAGQTLAINQNQAIFALLGTTYGGNGISTFLLPDLRGRVPIHWGQGAGQPNYVIGESGGLQSVTLVANNLPLHNHSMSVYKGAGGIGAPTNNVLAQGPVVSNANVNLYATSANTTMSAAALTSTGGSQPVSILQPYLALNYCIAIAGIFPSRN